MNICYKKNRILQEPTRRITIYFFSHLLPYQQKLRLYLCYRFTCKIAIIYNARLAAIHLVHIIIIIPHRRHQVVKTFHFLWLLDYDGRWTSSLINCLFRPIVRALYTQSSRNECFKNAFAFQSTYFLFSNLMSYSTPTQQPKKHTQHSHAIILPSRVQWYATICKIYINQNPHPKRSRGNCRAFSQTVRARAQQLISDSGGRLFSMSETCDVWVRHISLCGAVFVVRPFAKGTIAEDATT